MGKGAEGKRADGPGDRDKSRGAPGKLSTGGGSLEHVNAVNLERTRCTGRPKVTIQVCTKSKNNLACVHNI